MKDYLLTTGLYVGGFCLVLGVMHLLVKVMGLPIFWAAGAILAGLWIAGFVVVALTEFNR